MNAIPTGTPKAVVCG